jgi:hypothetical protein
MSLMLIFKADVELVASYIQSINTEQNSSIKNLPFGREFKVGKRDIFRSMVSSFQSIYEEHLLMKNESPHKLLITDIL